MLYFITLFDVYGAITGEGAVAAINPMEAIHKYGAERGWKPSRDSLDDSSSSYGYWTLTEADGTLIAVEETGE